MIAFLKRLFTLFFSTDTEILRYKLGIPSDGRFINYIAAVFTCKMLELSVTQQGPVLDTLFDVSVFLR